MELQRRMTRLMSSELNESSIGPSQRYWGADVQCVRRSGESTGHKVLVFLRRGYQ